MSQPKPGISNLSSRMSVFMASWEDISETGEGCEIVGSLERCVQVSGEFDGSTMRIQGSNDGEEWFDLTNQLGMLISFRSRDLCNIAEAPRFVRPYVYKGGEKMKVTCRIVYRQAR